MFLISLLLAATITTKADVPRVSPDELLSLMAKGDAVAIDVRGSVPYELGHIKGAKWVPLGLLGQRVAELPEDKLIVSYCTCKAEETSLEAAMLLASQYGYRVAVLSGGFPAWKDAGHPIEVIQTVEFEESQPTQASGSRGGRLAPPAAVSCDPNNLTSHSGKITSYKRQRGKTVLVMHTSAETVERLTITHRKSDDPSRFYLIEGTAFTSRDWTRIEQRKGKLRNGLSAIAWVCGDGTTFIDWRPGVTFTGAE
jgi:rhodanese-related sulfurtransferase